jgi:serine/threonine-protein kinase ATR
MTDALGLTKHEGVYRSVCELTLRVLRDNKDTLMSVLETFIYDPLVEWTSKSHRSTVRWSPSNPCCPHAVPHIFSV